MADSDDLPSSLGGRAGLALAHGKADSRGMIGGDEGEAGAVDAVAEVGGGVVAFAFEDVAEVAAAFGAGDFGAEHSAGVVGVVVTFSALAGS